MDRVVLITGASSGIGRVTAERFAENGWGVAATMRSPEDAGGLVSRDNVFVARLDVTDSETIAAAVTATLDRFGRIDALVNNAGYSLTGAFETLTEDQIRAQFDVNVFGLMEVTRAVLPHMRERGGGVIINVASVGGRLSFPAMSLYHATKWAVEGFSESLQYELGMFGIRVKLIEPGPIKTDFYGRSMQFGGENIDAYRGFLEKVKGEMDKTAQKLGAPPEKTARVIYRAATDGSRRLRYPAAGYAGPLLFLRRFLPEGLFHAAVRGMMKD